jgi:hypothetical protein
MRDSSSAIAFLRGMNEIMIFSTTSFHKSRVNSSTDINTALFARKTIL